MFSTRRINFRISVLQLSLTLLPSIPGVSVGGDGTVGGGCVGDHVRIEEPRLGERGGRWCGEGTGLNVYYSETDTVVLTLHAASTSQGEYFDNPLRLKIK